MTSVNGQKPAMSSINGVKDTHETNTLLLTSLGNGKNDLHHDDVMNGQETMAFVKTFKGNAEKEEDRMRKHVDAAGEKDDIHERHMWSNKAEYILSMLGCCVGLGNVWRFPYICIRNGGGAFLIPFLICLVICGLPLYFLEVAMGQFVSRAVYHIYAISPMFRGLGIASVMLVFLASWYYIMILAWTLVFVWNSTKSPQPWTVCGQPWNTPRCFERGHHANDNLINDDLAINALYNVTDDYLHIHSSAVHDNGTVNGSFDHVWTGNVSGSNLTLRSTSPSEEFWKHNVLELTSGLGDMGGLTLHNTLALFLASAIAGACIIKGVKSVGKVVYVTATLPYILITVLLIRGLTLPGAGDGVRFYFKPDFSKLMLIQTWLEALVQVFYSLGPGWGVLVTMSSYNRFKNNCMIDSLLLVLVCEGTSIYAGIATFSYLGHMSYKLSIPVANFSTSGPGLVFVVFPEAISYLPLPQLWGVLFFIMLFTLGLDSQFVFLETVLSCITDVWPKFVRRWEIPLKVAFFIALFLLGLPFCARGGMYIFQLVDWYVGAFTLMIITVFECIIVSWIYGSNRFSRDIELMIGRTPPYIFIVMWAFVTPAITAIACVCTLIFYTSPTYEGYTYDGLGIFLGWCVALVPFIPIPTYAVLQLCRAQGSFLQRVKSSCRATDEWTPSDPELREQYKLDRNDADLCMFHFC